jgi:maltose alpha-D-glucosyltransferase/alpha-amylase
MSLDLVTDAERDFLLAEYAPDQRMRLTTGIRRRLAPLVDADRTLLELCVALQLSMPGSPILYYGDEIGMGDNLMLTGLNSVRTPMQWSPDRNGGFSAGEPDRLTLPVAMDSLYGYQATNVEAQMRSRTSLLGWTKRLIEVRRDNVPFALGTYQHVNSSNPAVLAYIRATRDGTVLCVANFSRFPQPVNLDLMLHAGRTPIELLGGTRFPPIIDADYPLSLPGHGFYWFRLG